VVPSCLEKQNVVAFRITEHGPLSFRAKESIFADSGYRSLKIRNLKKQNSGSSSDMLRPSVTR
jgi:hypothetical protein